MGNRGILVVALGLSLASFTFAAESKLTIDSSASVSYCRSMNYAWSLNIQADSPGFSMLLGTVSEAPGGDWAEPNVPGRFGVGFDLRNVKSDNPFNADGNIFDRPQREVSLHWNGREIANRLCPVPFADGQHDFSVNVAATNGGSDVTVLVDGKSVYDRQFVPGLTPAQGPWQVAGNGISKVINPVTKGDMTPIAPPRPIKVSIFKDTVNDAQHHKAAATVDFPESLRGIGRVVGTLRLKPTPAGLDRWDRVAQIFLTDDRGERFEVLRYITPYRKGWEWQLDLTDLLPLFAGHRKFDLECETWGEGWLVDFDLDFYPGRPALVPYKVVNLWNGTEVIGQGNENSMFKVPLSKDIDRGAAATKARFVVTGHGQMPNSDNAAEFIPLWRKFIVNDTPFTDVLWKTDNYLNPCRPQGGTWKYDRAGWAPGDVVRPWLVDITNNVRPGASAKLQYAIEPYTNKTPDNGNPARQIFGSQLIFYRKP